MNSTNNASYLEEEHDFYSNHEVAISIARVVIVIFALVSLVLCSLVLVIAKILNKTATGNLLLAMIIASIVSIVGEILNQMKNYIYYIDSLVPLCRLTYILLYTGCLSWLWLHVALVAERAITRTLWLLGQRQLTMRPLIAWIIISIIVIISVILGSFPLWTIAQDGGYVYSCNMYHNSFYHTYEQTVLRYMYYILPVVFVIILTVWLVVVEVITRQRRRPDMQTPDVESVQLELTYLTLVLALIFVMLEVPFSILSIARIDNSRPGTQIFLGLNVLGLFVLGAAAITFPLFCFISPLFRQAIKTILGYGNIKNAATTEQNVEMK